MVIAPWILVVLVVWLSKCSCAMITPASRRLFLAQSAIVQLLPMTRTAGAKELSTIENDRAGRTPAAAAADAEAKQVLPVTTTTTLGMISKAPPRTIVVPIEYAPDLSAYIVRFRIGDDVFAGILDTGSPFLTVPSYCTTIVWDSAKKWGCYDPTNDGSEVFAQPTYERFDNNEGRIDWRRTTRFAFLNGTKNPPQEVPLLVERVGPDIDEATAEAADQQPQQLVFGILEGSLIGGSGGVFLGLIRDTDKDLRPSFLGQIGIQSFTIDFVNNLLTLSDQALWLPTTAVTTTTTTGPCWIPLVADLRRYGDPALHYTARAASVLVNGGPLVFDNKPVYVIFDTGVTGMVVSLELWEDRYRVARANKERSLWGDVEIAFVTTTTTTAKKGKGVPGASPLRTLIPPPTII
jgi:hypothetical protein